MCAAEAAYSEEFRSSTPTRADDDAATAHAAAVLRRLGIVDVSKEVEM